MSERLNKATICSVVILDILEQSNKSIVKQTKDNELLNRIIDEAIKDVTRDDHVLVDTSGGKAMALFGAPEAALFIAMMIRDAVVKHNKVSEDKLFIRAGLSVGPVSMSADINGLPGIQGDGANVAERVKNLARPNQILVSRVYYDITSGLTDEMASMFSHFDGEQGVYSVRSPEEELFVPESTVEPPADASLFSRLLKNEDSPRYGLWGSIALAAIVLLVGGFMLISSVRHPDLGVVIADSKPPARVEDLHKVAAPSASTQFVAPETHEAAPNLVEPADAEPSVTIVTTQPGTAQPVKAKPPVTQPPVTQPPATQPVAATATTDTYMDVPSSDSLAEDEETVPEEQAVVPQKEVKKVAASPQARSGPVVEERRLPSGGVRPKTIWDEFRKSFKQGRKEHVCTQAEVALNQCK